MGSGGNFGDDASKICMQLCLAENLVGHDFGRLPACLTDHSGGGVVAAAFYAEDRESIRQGSDLLCGAFATGNTIAMVQTIPPTVLLTRPRAASERLAAQISAQVVISPLMEVIWRSVPVLGEAPDAVVFTSQNGVEGFVRNADWRGVAYCVGDRTAQAAQAAGFQAVSAGGDLSDLKAMLAARAKGARLIHARGLHVAGDLGDIASPLITYEQRPLALSLEARKVLSGMNKVVVPLFSPRSAALFVQEFSRIGHAPLVVVAISKSVAKACSDAGLEVAFVASSPDGAAMINAIEAACA